MEAQQLEQIYTTIREAGARAPTKDAIVEATGFDQELVSEALDLLIIKELVFVVRPNSKQPRYRTRWPSAWLEGGAPVPAMA